MSSSPKKRRARHTAIALSGVVVASTLSSCTVPPVLTMADCGASSLVKQAIRSVVVTSPDLSPDQRHNAQTIMGVAKDLGFPDWVGTFAVGVAYHESNLTNLPGGDGTSVGLFQQIDIYGTKAQRMDRVWATRMFLVGGRGANGGSIKGLREIKGWESYADGKNWDKLAIARQNPSVSAYYSRTHNIVDNLAKIVLWLTGRVTYQPDTGSQMPAVLNCTVRNNGGPDAAILQKTLLAARSQIGVPYVWGGEDPKTGPTDTGGFDCSGFTQWVFEQVGVKLTHFAATQAKEAPVVPGAQWVPSSGDTGLSSLISILQPGDLIFLRAQDGNVYHVALYVGDGNIIDARRRGTDIAVRPLSSAPRASDTVFAGRPLSLASSGPVTAGSWGYPLASVHVGSECGMRLHPILHYTRLHSGQDLSLTTGTPVMAIADGTVTLAGWNGSYGNQVKISHGVVNGHQVESAYAHNSRLVVTQGQTVTKGQVIAYGGSTGLSTGPHSHFEIKVDGTYIKGIPFIDSQARTAISCLTGNVL